MNISEIKRSEFYSTSILGEPCVIFVLDEGIGGRNPSGKYIFWNLTLESLGYFSLLNKGFIENLVLVEDLEELRFYRNKIINNFDEYKKRASKHFFLLALATDEFTKKYKGEGKIEKRTTDPDIMEMYKDTMPLSSFDKTYLALKYLVEISEEAQKEYRKNPQTMNAKAHAKEISTIRLTTSRRSGHTLAMLRLIKEKFERVAFVSLNSQSVDQIKILAQEEDVLHKIYLTHQNDIGFLKGKVFEAIFVDCSYALSKKQIEDIYTIFGPMMISSGEPFYFVFVQ